MTLSLASELKSFIAFSIIFSLISTKVLGSKFSIHDELQNSLIRTKHDWVKETDFGGADYMINDYEKVVDQVKEITQGKMADVVLNSLGIETWVAAIHQLVLTEDGLHLLL